MFQEIFDSIKQAFEFSGKKSHPFLPAKPAAGKERRKAKRANAKDRRKSSLRLQDWKERDRNRLKSGNLHWEGYP